MTDHTPDRRTVLAGLASAAAAALPAAASSDGTLHEVDIRNFKFIPVELTVRPGDRIRWTNRDGAPHDATAVGKEWNTRVLQRNESAEVTVTADMTTEYYCSIHPYMRAALVVTTS